MTFLSLIISVGYVNVEPFHSNCLKRVRACISLMGLQFRSEDLPVLITGKICTQNSTRFSLILFVFGISECVNAMKRKRLSKFFWSGSTWIDQNDQATEQSNRPHSLKSKWNTQKEIFIFATCNTPPAIVFGKWNANIRNFCQKQSHTKKGKNRRRFFLFNVEGL